MLRNTLIALALTSVLTAGACGGGGNDDSAAATSDDKAESADAASRDGASTGSESDSESGPGEAGESFCENANALYDQLTSAGASDPTSPEVQAVLDEAKALDAPDEIQADWTAVLDTLVAPVVSGEIDVDDPEGSAELTQRAADLGAGLQRIGTYFETECGFGTT